MESVKSRFGERAQHKMKSKEQDTSSRSGNDAHVDDADIKPIYDEEPMAEVPMTADNNVSAYGLDKHMSNLNSLMKDEDDQNAETISMDIKTFASSTTKVESEPPNGSNADIPNQCESEQALNVSACTLLSTAVQASVVNVKWCLLKITLQAPSGLVLHQMTSDHNRSELGIQDHSNEQSSSKLVPKVVP
ncbi:hypothetical protein Tco_1111952 [Tanacetum coccineum]|uniref:Uncharacterized protein n=1 Tax=Tanacetum coccineum TaxID=301880 RepID=A0ABQ5IN29_9ASTR